MDVAVSVEIRQNLVILARRRRARVTEWTRERPSKWRPRTVKNPSTGDYFTNEGAWHFVADLLEKGHPIEQITLMQPPNKRGFVMHVELESNPQRLYVKLELGCGIIFGRSFHYDD